MSKKYNFGRFITLFGILRVYGRNKYTIPDTCNTDNHFFAELKETPASLEISFKLNRLPKRDATRIINEWNIDKSLILIICRTSRSIYVWNVRRIKKRTFYILKITIRIESFKDSFETFIQNMFLSGW